MYRDMLELTDKRSAEVFVPQIKVIGLGGGGSNAVDRMIAVGIPGIEYIAANTDRQSLSVSEAPTRIQLGARVTRGLGAGGKAEVGREAALESESALEAALEGADLVFIAAGMGGGTGTGSAPITARIARELGALTVAVVTCPFAFEGSHRARTAQAGMQELGRHAHTLIRVQNDQLLQVAPRNLRLDVAFRVADDILRQGIQGITELVTQAGLINLDFASVGAVIRQGGNALMAIGHGDKLQKAADIALRHPLLEHSTIDRATSVLVHITGGPDLGLAQVNQVMLQIIQSVNPAAEVLFGVSEDPEMEGRAQVILIATGIQEPADEPIVIRSLFGVPLPEADAADRPRELEVPKINESLDLPAFMRRRELFGAQSVQRVEAWAG